MYVWPPDAVQVMSSGSGQAGLSVVSHTGQGSGSPPACSGLGVLPGLQPWPGGSSGTSRELVWWWHDVPGRGSPEPILGFWCSCGARGDPPRVPRLGAGGGEGSQIPSSLLSPSECRPSL